MTAEQQPDADEIARSMLLLYGAHDDDHGARDDSAREDNDVAAGFRQALRAAVSGGIGGVAAVAAHGDLGMD